VPARRWKLGTFRALRHHNYRLYFTGQLVSLTGSWVQTTALTWLAYDLTGQNTWPALVSAAQVTPTLLLGVWGGGLADRWPRRPLILATQGMQLALAVLLGALVLCGAATPWGLVAVAAALGVVNAVDTPARLAFVIDMVGRDDLANAVALNSLLFNLARALGPALGASLLDAVGPGACFLVNALSFGTILAALAAMRLPRRSSPARHQQTSVVDGFRFVAGRGDLLLLLLLAGALALFGWPLLSLLPDVSARRLQAGSAGYARMLSAVGSGALVGALVVASFHTARARRVLLGVGVALGSLSLAGLAVATDLGVAVACCAASGGGLILFFATGQAMMQLGAGDDNRGRVLGIWLMVLSGANPLGHLLAGRLADRWGVAPVLAGMAAGIALAALCALAAVVVKRNRAGRDPCR
jgi:MFS family permease